MSLGVSFIGLGVDHGARVAIAGMEGVRAKGSWEMSGTWWDDMCINARAVMCRLQYVMSGLGMDYEVGYGMDVDSERRRF
jgi:hypothetical protein